MKAIIFNYSLCELPEKLCKYCKIENTDYINTEDFKYCFTGDETAGWTKYIKGTPSGNHSYAT